MKIDIVLVDDHRIFREGIRALLNQQEDMRVVGEAADGRSAAVLIKKLRPQVVITDMAMPGLNGIGAAHRIIEDNPGVRVIALSMHADKRLVREMLKAGARGYLLKECAFEELVQAIRTVCDEESVCLSPEIARLVVDDYLHSGRGAGPGAGDRSPLAASEREILQLIAEGCTSEKIGQILHMSRRTVEKHRARLMCTGL